MNFASLRKIAVVAAALVPLSIAAPAFGQTGGVAGKATLQDGTPCAKCIILIERQGIKGTYKTKTGKNGDFVYIGLPIDNYKITLEDPNGQQLFYISKHVGLGDPTEADFDMKTLVAQQQQQQQQQHAEEIKEHPEIAQKEEQQKEAAAKQEKEFTGLKQFFDQGNTLYAQQNYKGAAAAYEQALPLAKGKNVPIVLAKLADSYQKAGQNDQAVSTYQKAIQLSPDDPSLHNNLGSVYAQMNKMAEAQTEFETAAKLDPPNAARYYFNVGAILYNAGKMDDAVTAFKKVIEIDPKNAEAYYLEGQALMGKATMTPDGKVSVPDGTAEAFHNYLKLAPNGPNAEAAKGMLQTIENNVPTGYKKRKGQS